MRLKYLILALAILAGHSSLSGNAWARPWKPSPVEIAQDYLMIEHVISDSEKILIMWMAPEYFEDTADNRAIREIVREYMLVAVIHFRISQLGEWQFVIPAGVTVDINDSQSLAPIFQQSLPPLVTATLDLLREGMAAGMGKMGEGMRLFVYDGTRFDRCGEDVLWINYLTERYDFQAPLPGCG